MGECYECHIVFDCLFNFYSYIKYSYVLNAGSRLRWMREIRREKSGLQVYNEHPQGPKKSIREKIYILIIKYFLVARYYMNGG